MDLTHVDMKDPVKLRELAVIADKAKDRALEAGTPVLPNHFSEIANHANAAAVYLEKRARQIRDNKILQEAQSPGAAPRPVPGPAMVEGDQDGNPIEEDG